MPITAILLIYKAKQIFLLYVSPVLLLCIVSISARNTFCLYRNLAIFKDTITQRFGKHFNWDHKKKIMIFRNILFFNEIEEEIVKTNLI